MTGAEIMAEAILSRANQIRAAGGKADIAVVSGKDYAALNELSGIIVQASEFMHEGKFWVGEQVGSYLPNFSSRNLATEFEGK